MTHPVRDSWIIDSEDARQERELRRLEGRSTKATLSQIQTDLLRKRIRLRRGKRLVSIDAVSALDDRSLGDKLAAERHEEVCEVSRDPWDRALRLLDGVPEPTRTALHNVLSILRTNHIPRRLQLWRQQNPGRNATQREIAIEIGVARETLTRNVAGVWQRYGTRTEDRERITAWIESHPSDVPVRRAQIAREAKTNLDAVYKVLAMRRGEGKPVPPGVGIRHTESYQRKQRP